jgi:glc operon protein GlcG
MAERKIVSQQMVNPYGANIPLAAAKKVAAGAAAAAILLKVNIAIAIVDAGGNLLYLERFDAVQFGSVDVAVHKAKCSVAYKRPTKAFEDAISDGRLAIFTLDGICTVEGGLPILMDGKIVGAIGVSGGTAGEDGQIAKAGLQALA